MYTKGFVDEIPKHEIEYDEDILLEGENFKFVKKGKTFYGRLEWP